MGKLRRVRWFKWAFVVCLVLLAWFIYVQWKIQAVQQMMFTSDAADTGIVLGAALWDNVPSPALRERLELAYELYAQGYYSHIIVSGGRDRNDSTLSEAEGMKQYLVWKGVPPANIIEENRAVNTYQNLLYSQAIMDAHSWRSAIIVTHQYHALRAREMARFIGMKQATVAATDSQVMWMPWHKARETLAYTKWQLQKAFMVTGIIPSKR